MYLKYNRQKITDIKDETIEKMYSNGYVMTRIEKGSMDQTKSLRIDLSRFETTSENRRILRKTENVILHITNLPISENEYNWQIHKIGKDFYTIKFGDKTFSANKIKELIKSKHNFNKLFTYSIDNEEIGYCIVLETQNLIHYCYPFYQLNIETKNIGMGMMLRAILWAKDNNKKYIYLGSVQRETDKYKLQFKGLELFDPASGWEELNI